MRSATSQTSPPLPPSPPFGPPSDDRALAAERHAAGAAVAAAHVQLALVDESAAHRTVQATDGTAHARTARRLSRLDAHARRTPSPTITPGARVGRTLAPWHESTSAPRAGRRRWPATGDGRRRLAHADSWAGTGRPTQLDRAAREDARSASTWRRSPPRPTAPATGPSRRSPTRGAPASSATATASCTSPAFRRLAGKTQVFVFPDDHQRTRLTHALEVAQVATSVARALGLNVALTEAIALGHDCGHGPGGHASEDALSPVRRRRATTTPCGAPTSRWPPLNLCAETLDGIRNHSWCRPGADHAGGRGRSLGRPHRLRLPRLRGRRRRPASSSPTMLPAVVRDRCGDRRSQQLGAFISGDDRGRRRHRPDRHDRRRWPRRWPSSAGFNYEHIYLRAGRRAQADAVIALLRALVEHYADSPRPAARCGASTRQSSALRAAVTYVGGMTDRFACQRRVRELGWDRVPLPASIDP